LTLEDMFSGQMVGTLRDTHLSAAMNISVEMTYSTQQNQVCAPNPASYE